MRQSGIQLQVQLHGTGALAGGSNCRRGWARRRLGHPDLRQLRPRQSTGQAAVAASAGGRAAAGGRSQLPVLRQKGGAAHRVMPFLRAMRFSTVNDTRMALAASSAGTWNLRKAEGEGATRGVGGVWVWRRTGTGARRASRGVLLAASRRPQAQQEQEGARSGGQQTLCSATRQGRVPPRAGLQGRRPHQDASSSPLISLGRRPCGERWVVGAKLGRSVKRPRTAGAAPARLQPRVPGRSGERSPSATSSCAAAGARRPLRAPRTSPWLCVMSGGFRAGIEVMHCCPWAAGTGL